MPLINKSVLVPFSAATMFDLVDEIERYPEFLPWCESTTLIERNVETTAATINLNYRGIRHAFSTRNSKHAKSQMEIALIEGPFKHLVGHWRFTVLNDNACKVELQLDYAFSNFLLEKTLGAVFEMICKTMIERFVARAHALAAR